MDDILESPKASSRSRNLFEVYRLHTPSGRPVSNSSWLLTPSHRNQRAPVRSSQRRSVCHAYPHSRQVVQPSLSAGTWLRFNAQHGQRCMKSKDALLLPQSLRLSQTGTATIPAITAASATHLSTPGKVMPEKRSPRYARTSPVPSRFTM